MPMIGQLSGGLIVRWNIVLACTASKVFNFTDPLAKCLNLLTQVYNDFDSMKHQMLVFKFVGVALPMSNFNCIASFLTVYFVPVLQMRFPGIYLRSFFIAVLISAYEEEYIEKRQSSLGTNIWILWKPDLSSRTNFISEDWQLVSCLPMTSLILSNVEGNAKLNFFSSSFTHLN